MLIQILLFDYVKSRYFDSKQYEITDSVFIMAMYLYMQRNGMKEDDDGED